MKTNFRSLAFTVILTALGLGCSALMAQDNGATTTPTPPPGAAPAQGFGGGPGGPGGPGGRNFDPAQFQQQMQQRMGEFLRGKLNVTNDDEWKVISAQIDKVNTARAEANSGAIGGVMGMLGGGRRGGGGGPGGMGGGPGGPGGGFGGPGGPGGGFQIPGMSNVQPDPAEEALQRAVDANASNDELKAAISKLIDSRKQKQEAFVKAQADLRKLLSVRQEAIAYTMGLL